MEYTDESHIFLALYLDDDLREVLPHERGKLDPNTRNGKIKQKKGKMKITTQL